MDETTLNDVQTRSERRRARKPSIGRRIWLFTGRLLCVLLVTVLLLTGGLYGVMLILTHGPSPTARDLFVRSVRETSAVGFLANLCLSKAQIAEIEAKKPETVYETDTSLVTVNTEHTDTPQTDAWGFMDEDGDGVVIDEVHGEGYSGFMMIVYDPSQVILGFDPEKMGQRGYTVDEMVKKFDALGGTNAGGFADEGGMGDGSTPDHLVVYEGEIYAGGAGVGDGFVGIDDEYKLHVGLQSAQDIKNAHIRYGCSFGPVLVSNGQGVDTDSLASGINPRTAIGQRSDGAILLLVIDGRQVISLGATYEDLTNIMLSYGAVNASNLDGGSSTLMYFDGAYLNNCASVIGIRQIPTAWLVMKEGKA